MNLEQYQALPTLRPSQHAIILFLSHHPKAVTHFTVPQKRDC